MHLSFLRSVRLHCSWLVALAACGCSTYYPSYRYVPRNEVHEIRVRDAEVETERARVDAKVIGILRPQGSPERRVHAQLVVKNTGHEPLTFPVAESRLVPSGVMEISPHPVVPQIDLQPGESRSVELFFPLPGADELPNSALLELDLRWSLDLNGTRQNSHANFRIRSRRDYNYSGGYYYGGYYPYRWWGYPRFTPYYYGYCD